jgi:hypothetical protein
MPTIMSEVFKCQSESISRCVLVHGYCELVRKTMQDTHDMSVVASNLSQIHMHNNLDIKEMKAMLQPSIHYELKGNIQIFPLRVAFLRETCTESDEDNEKDVEWHRTYWHRHTAIFLYHLGFSLEAVFGEFYPNQKIFRHDTKRDRCSPHTHCWEPPFDGKLLDYENTLETSKPADIKSPFESWIETNQLDFINFAIENSKNARQRMLEEISGYEKNQFEEFSRACFDKPSFIKQFTEDRDFYPEMLVKTILKSAMSQHTESAYLTLKKFNVKTHYVIVNMKYQEYIGEDEKLNKYFQFLNNMEKYGDFLPKCMMKSLLGNQGLILDRDSLLKFLEKCIKRGEADFLSYLFTSDDVIRGETVRKVAFDVMMLKTRNIKNQNCTLFSLLVSKGDILARHRFEILSELKRRYNTFQGAIVFLKNHVPETNPNTMKMVDQLKYEYPLETGERFSIAVKTLFTILAETALSIADICSDIRLTWGVAFCSTCITMEALHCLKGVEYSKHSVMDCSNLVTYHPKNCMVPNISDYSPASERLEDEGVCGMEIVEECAIINAMIPHFVTFSSVLLILPWVISLFIVLANRKDINALFPEGKSSTSKFLTKVMKVCIMLTFPLSGFAVLAYYQFQLKKMQRQTKLRDNEREVKTMERDVENIVSIVGVAGKVTEVVTESSFQPFLQFYVLLTGCNLITTFCLIFQDPKAVFKSDLQYSILVSLINFSWSMTFHQVTKDITVDITTNLFQRLVLALSYFFQTGNRLFILCLFGHEWYGSNHLSGLIGFLLVHIFTMLFFNIIFSDLKFTEHAFKTHKKDQENKEPKETLGENHIAYDVRMIDYKSYWLEMLLNSFGCAFIHNWIKLKRSNRFHVRSLLRQVVFETFMFAQNCMLITFALTLDNESSLLNTEIKFKKDRVAGVCFVAFFLGLFLKAFYYYCLHPWPTFRGTMCSDLKETLRNLTEDGKHSITENIQHILLFGCFSGFMTSIYLIIYHQSYTIHRLHLYPLVAIASISLIYPIILYLINRLKQEKSTLPAKYKYSTRNPNKLSI